MDASPKRFYEFGPFHIDTVKRLLVREEKPITLKPKCFDLLLALVETRGEVLEKEELMRRVWPDTTVEESNITVYISALRKALGESPQEHRYIITVPGRGYSFVAEVRETRNGQSEFMELELADASPIAKTKDKSVEPVRPGESQAAPVNAPLPSSSNRRWRMKLAIGAASVALLGSSIIGFYWWKVRSYNSISSIAVLPFTLLNSEADEYLSAGLADVLITRLSNLKRIAVRPTSAILKYKDRQQDPVEIGREQKVDAVLEGSIHQSGHRIRVTARLVNVRDGSSLWAGKFDERASDIFTAEDVIAQQLAAALALNLNAEEKQSLVKRGTDNVEAQQLYLKGRFFWNKRNEEATLKGLEFFEQAINLDPNYALAYVGLADSYALELSGLAPVERKEKMKVAAMKALEIDETLAEAHLSLAFVKHHYDWDWSGAEKEYRRAIELDPNYAQAHNWYAVYLTYLKEPGWFENARAEFKRALELDPTSLIINTNAGYLYTYAGLYDQAIAQLRKTVELDPSFARAHIRLGQTYGFKGMPEPAIAELKEGLRLSGRSPDFMAALGYAYARSGKRDEALDVLRELDEMCSKNMGCLYHGMAIIHASLGEKDRAIELLQRAVEIQEPYLGVIKVIPYYDSLRSDPRFANLVRRVGLEP